MTAACTGATEPVEVVTAGTPEISAPTPAPTPFPTALTLTPAPIPTPTPEPSPTVDPREADLAELRATDRFLELAEHERAQQATWARFGYDAFAPFSKGEKLFEWSNKAALWDEVAPPFRDECLLAGPEATRPMWDSQVLVPAGIEPRWSDATTESRGQFVEFICLYVDEASGEPVERWGAVLIAADPANVGRVIAEMEPFEVREEQYENFQARRDGVRGVLWEWVFSQPQL